MRKAALPYETLSADSFLEYAFLRWVLTPALSPAVVPLVIPQYQVSVGGHTYYLDYALLGREQRIAIELDGFAFHGDRTTFTADRLRQNDLQAEGWTILRFSYDAIRLDVSRCVGQLQAICALDPSLATYLYTPPLLTRPEMDPDPLTALRPLSRSRALSHPSEASYFDTNRERLNLKTLRRCQVEAFAALGHYYRTGGTHAACVMSVGAGKTTLGVAACLAFTTRRALIITPGNVIRGTFDKALNAQTVGNSLYGLPNGPLIPGCKPPRTLTLDREEGAVRQVQRADLLTTEIIITNFQSLGTGTDPEDILAKLTAEDIDFIVVDEAHIAASDSYQRAFHHFPKARTLLMSACFQRLDGKPIDAEVVYRYRLIDSIADGNAKNVRVHRFAPTTQETTYEMVWPDGRREELVGRDTLLALIQDARKLARITAKSDASIRQVMRVVRNALDQQKAWLSPVKPRVLFSALGEQHAEQIARVAEEYGIPCSPLHYTMSEARIRAIRSRYEQDSGDLEGIVQLKMLGQGYDFPPITVVVPMRPYGSFSEFYQFIGRGIRALYHPALLGRVGPEHQFLDIIYHAELGLDEHIETIYRENDMDPRTLHPASLPGESMLPEESLSGDAGREMGERPEAFVLFERGTIEERVIHDAARVEQRRHEREQEALAQHYAAYAESTAEPVPFAEFVRIMRMLRE